MNALNCLLFAQALVERLNRGEPLGAGTAEAECRSAISRAYYAAFYAAEAALLSRGETRSKHSGVVAAFIQIIVRDAGLEPDAGRLLRSLFDRRNHADYTTDSVSSDEASIAIADAQRVVDLVARWLADGNS